MVFLRYLFIFCFSASLFAEHLEQPNQVYNQNSKLTVNNINQAVEVLRNPMAVVTKNASMAPVGDLSGITEAMRDPTLMSGNFRQALQGYRANSKGSSTGASKGPVVPAVALIGKVFIPVTSEVELFSLRPSSKPLPVSSVALSFGGSTLHLKEGDTSSMIKNEHVTTLKVIEIARDFVKVSLSPNNEELILH